MKRDVPPELEREFDVAMARSGIAVPGELRAGALAGFAEIRRMTALVRRPRSPEAEPSNVYDARANAHIPPPP